MIRSRATLDYNYLDTKARLDEVMHSFIPDAEILSLKRHLPKEPDSKLVQIVALHRWNRRVCNRFKSCPLYKAKSQSVYSTLHLCPKCSCTGTVLPTAKRRMPRSMPSGVAEKMPSRIRGRYVCAE